MTGPDKFCVHPYALLFISGMSIFHGCNATKINTSNDSEVASMNKNISAPLVDVSLAIKLRPVQFGLLTAFQSNLETLLKSPDFVITCSQIKWREGGGFIHKNFGFFFLYNSNKGVFAETSIGDPDSNMQAVAQNFMVNSGEMLRTGGYSLGYPDRSKPKLGDILLWQSLKDIGINPPSNRYEIIGWINYLGSGRMRTGAELYSDIDDSGKISVRNATPSCNR